MRDANPNASSEYAQVQQAREIKASKLLDRLTSGAELLCGAHLIEALFLTADDLAADPRDRDLAQAALWLLGEQNPNIFTPEQAARVYIRLRRSVPAV